MIKKLLLLPFLCLFFCNTFSQNWDIDLLKKINLDRNKNLDPSFKFISNSTGTITIAAPLCAIGFALMKKDSISKKNAIYLSSSLVLTTLFSTSLKHIFKRDRPFVTYPYLDKQSDGGSYSFPSGHTSSAFSLATSLSLAYRKWYVIAPAYVWASSVGYSRMHLGVHYPSDVIAGAI